ncbi:MAG: sulfotransferase domain-containing protein [Desulfatirhabdiaceae bacterium]
MADPAAINGLLLQDLGRTPFMAAPMPSDWLQSDAAVKAGNRIKNLIDDIGDTDQPYYLSDPLFCKSLPLWLEVVKKKGMAVNCIHILRHPWEVAQSLNNNKHIDLIKAHILWLSCTHSAIRAMQDHAYTLITFDQLLADPLSALHSLRLTSSASILSSHYSLIDMVQPSQKHHHAAMLPDPEKKTCRPLERLYNQLCTSRYSDADLSFLPYKSEKVVRNRGLPEEKVPLVPDIVDTLLQVIGQQEFEIDCIPYVSQSKNASFQEGSIPHQLYFRIGFDPNDLTDFPLLPDQWHKITLPVHQPDKLMAEGLVLAPLNTTGTVWISAVNLVNKATGEVLWSAKNGSDFDRFVVQGQALRLPNQDNLLILVTGENALVNVRVEGHVPNAPLEVEMWVKVGRGLDVLHGKQYMLLGWDDHSIQKLCSDDRLLHNNKIPRMLLPIWPETYGNSTPVTLKYLASQRTGMITTKKFAQSVSYKLPTYLVSFPRSGSNFLQTVLEKSSGFRCCSLYSPRPADPEYVLSLKSHALSPDYLYDEIKRYLPRAQNPEKIIFLRRDPRDVMISFYEFVLNLKQIKIEQNVFLHNVCYQYAFDSNPPMVQSSRRKVETSPMNIQAAYQRHIEAWVSSRPDDLDILDVSFENLVSNPENEFKRIFDFLEINASLNKESLKIKVSQYSEEIRPRGVVYGWKNNFTHTTLINSVDKYLKVNIDILGYGKPSFQSKY